MRKTFVKAPNSAFMNYFAHMKPLVLFANSIIILALLIAAVAFISKKEEVPEKHVEVVLRSIGHQLLLSANDSSSRVLPVKKLNEHTYQISFQHDFGFVSDSLINLVQRTFEKDATANNYIVHLRNCAQKEAVFAFEINKQAGDLAPCRGRTLEVGCYIIEIEFLQKTSSHFFWWALLLIPLGVIAFYLKDRFRKKEVPVWVTETMDYLPLGSFQLYADTHVLKIDQKQIPLSEKETKALTLFAENINQIVERERLMKEIWEDQGLVVISRNVDVLVSKLRKKLMDDPAIKIINIPGKGYKCYIG
jgi:hypothetical protein